MNAQKSTRATRAIAVLLVPIVYSTIKATVSVVMAISPSSRLDLLVVRGVRYVSRRYAR